MAACGSEHRTGTRGFSAKHGLLEGLLGVLAVPRVCRWVLLKPEQCGVHHLTARLFVAAPEPAEFPHPLPPREAISDAGRFNGLGRLARQPFLLGAGSRGLRELLLSFWGRLERPTFAIMLGRGVVHRALPHGSQI